MLDFEIDCIYNGDDNTINDLGALYGTFCALIGFGDIEDYEPTKKDFERYIDTELFCMGSACKWAELVASDNGLDIYRIKDCSPWYIATTSRTYDIIGEGDTINEAISEAIARKEASKPHKSIIKLSLELVVNDCNDFNVIMEHIENIIPCEVVKASWSIEKGVI